MLETLYWGALALLALLQVADVWSTFGFLERGGVELNPIFRRLMERGDNLWVVVKAVGALFLLGLFYWIGPTGTALIVVGTLDLIYLVVVIKNTRIGR